MKNNQLKCKVHMLPTNKAICNNDLILVKHLKHDNWILNNQLGFASKLQHQPNDIWWKESGALITKEVNNGEILSQHLYLTSDRKIKEGDWVYDQFNNDISKIIKIGVVGRDTFKIEATTDPILDYFEPSAGAEMLSGKYKIPQIPDSFIQAYVKANGKINEVLIELRENTFVEFYNNKEKWHQQVKLRSDNSVIIHQIKDSYSREDMEKAFDTGYIKSSEIDWDRFGSLNEEESKNNPDYLEFKEWIENL